MSHQSRPRGQKGLVLLSAATITAVLAAYWNASRPAPEPEERAAAGLSSEPTPSVPAASRGEVALMRHELGRLRSQVEELHQNKQPPVPAPPAEEATAETAAEQRAASDQKWKEHMARLAESFEREPRDAHWSASTSQFVAGALGKEPALAALAGAVDCRSSTCRLELQHDDEGVVDKQLPLFLHNLGQTLPEAEADHAVVDGKSRYTLYLKRSRTVAAAAPAP